MGAIINDNSQKGLAIWKNKFGIQIIIQNKIEIKDFTRSDAILTSPISQRASNFVNNSNPSSMDKFNLLKSKLSPFTTPIPLLGLSQITKRQKAIKLIKNKTIEISNYARFFYIRNTPVQADSYLALFLNVLMIVNYHAKTHIVLLYHLFQKLYFWYQKPWT